MKKIPGSAFEPAVWLPFSAAAARVGMSAMWIRERAWAGNIRSFIISPRKWPINVVSLDTYLSSLKATRRA